MLAVACAAVVACVASVRGPDAATGTGVVAPLAQLASANARSTIPPGAQGDLVRYGRDLIEQTPRLAAANVTARMSCASCHPHGGTVAHAGSLIGAYAVFPQWNRRAHRFIALQDRIAECFLYSMNGTPPAYSSREMVAITAYIAWLSRGAPTGVGFRAQGPLAVVAPKTPSIARGAAVYAARCQVCHGQSGDGAAIAYPPLWGPHSFNDHAGMSRIDRMSPFVKAAMPANAPGTLTDQEAADVAAFVLAHSRPRFRPDRSIAFPAEKASYF